MPPIFDYKALSPDGKVKRGLIEAENLKAARQKIKKAGLIATAVSPKGVNQPSSSGGVPFFGGRVGTKEIAMLTRQLASLVKANIPLVEALTALRDQTDNEKLKIVVDKVRNDVNEGLSLAKALGAHPKIFDNIFINMVEAGESSGTLGLVLLRLADLKEAQLRLKNKVISGMTYPILMMAVAVLLLLLIFTFVIPKLTKIFDSMNKPVPMITKVLMGLSDYLVNYWYVLAALFFVAVIFFQRYISTHTGRLRWDAFRLRAPVFGPLFRMIAVTRFANTMGTLLGSGVPILTSMGIAKNLVGNVHIEKAIEEARSNITEGQSIAEPLRKSQQFPPLVIHMISIGEKTGELADMLRNVAESYEEQVNARIEGMTALLEPVMIIGMGGVVGFIVFAIFIPLLEISNIR